MTPDIAKLAGRFQFEGEFVDAKAYGFGHINEHLRSALPP